MDSFLIRYKNILVLVSILLAQIIGLAVQIRRPNPNARDGSSVRLIRSWAVGLITPPEKGLRGMGGGIRGLWSNYLDLRGVREQNQQLREQMNRLQLEQAALLEDARQGQRLQRLLSFREHYIYSTVPAQVIGTAGTDQSRVLYIDKGANAGLKPDMPVITQDGIVGKLKDVFSSTAQVLEISDQSSGAGVLLESTRLRGVLRGNALGQPQIINLLPDERIKAGDRILTSGGDQIYPRGLPVGVVDHVVSDAQNPGYVDVVVKPAANLGHLEEVLIITATDSKMPASQKADLEQSAAVGAAAGPQTAADILAAQRLPGLDEPATLADKAKADSDLNPPALRPPPPMHPDHFTPNATPPAADLTPGKAFSVDSSAPLPVAHPRFRTAPSQNEASTSTQAGHAPADAGKPRNSAAHKMAGGEAPAKTASPPEPALQQPSAPKPSPEQSH